MTAQLPELPTGGDPVARILVVHPSGDLDAVSAPGFRRTVEVAAGTGVPLVVVDMSDVDFLDSAGLAAVVGVHRHLPMGQRLALANVPARMRRVLKIAAMDTLFLVHEQGQPWPWPDAVVVDG